MADENDPTTEPDPDESTGPEQASDGAGPDDDEAQDAEDAQEAPAAGDDPDAEGVGRGTSSFRIPGAFTMGTVTLHTRYRDIQLMLDGASALRLLRIFQQRRDGALADHLDPYSSSAANAWVVADLDECIAVTWWPSVPTKGERTAIDPVVNAA